MLQGLTADIDPSGLIGQGAVRNEFERGLGRTDMHHVEFAGLTGYISIRVFNVEKGGLLFAIHCNECFAEAKIDAVFVDIFH